MQSLVLSDLYALSAACERSKRCGLHRPTRTQPETQRTITGQERPCVSCCISYLLGATLIVLLRCSPTLAECPRPASRRVDAVPRPKNAKDFRYASISGLHHTASRPLCTLRAAITRDYATLAHDVVANLSSLPVSHRKGLLQNDFRYSLPPFSEFRWRDLGLTLTPSGCILGPL